MKTLTLSLKALNLEDTQFHNSKLPYSFSIKQSPYKETTFFPLNKLVNSFSTKGGKLLFMKMANTIYYGI